MNKKESIENARNERSKRKREVLEITLARMRQSGSIITISGIAKAAGVSRAYLYNNYAKDLIGFRDEMRGQFSIIEGKKVPKRTDEEYMHVESLLRRKISRIESEGKLLNEKIRTAHQTIKQLQLDLALALGRNEQLRQLTKKQ